MAQRILITGASGYIARKLAPFLEGHGFEIVLLSRETFQSKWPVFTWNIDEKRIDDRAFEGVDTVINLAGASVGKRWTKRYRQEIVASRVEGTRLLHDWLATHQHHVRSLIAISGSGMYGHRPGEVLTEESKPGTGFLSELSIEWEAGQSRFAELGLRTVILRPGIVIAHDAPVLKPFLIPMRLFILPVAGSGRQVIPWVHIDDLMSVFLMMLRDESLNGTFNVAAPDAISNREFCRQLRRAYRFKTLRTRSPAFILKLMMGERAMLVLADTHVTSEKLMRAGFHFQYPRFEQAAQEMALRR